MRVSIASIVFAAVVTIAPPPCYGAEQTEVEDLGDGVHGVLYRPDGGGPFPAVVGLHCCGGLVNRGGNLVRRFADWGDRLAAAGLAVLFPDSYASRGLPAQCR